LLGVFGEYAPTFEEHLVGKLKYRVPEQLVQAIGATSAAATGDGKLDISDLGCGTGRVGELFRPLARSIIGVDLVPQMIVKSRERGVYDEVVQSEVAEFLHETDRRFDLILAADVFIYIGDLASVFEGAVKVLQPAGALPSRWKRTKIPASACGRPAGTRITFLRPELAMRNRPERNWSPIASRFGPRTSGMLRGGLSCSRNLGN
jgi:SAM-dependent methyltransferase